MYLSVQSVMHISLCFKKGKTMQNQKILILNFGGQYDQLIARRVRECKVYCEVRPYTMTLAEIQEFNPIGIIFTGGPDSVYKDNSYHPAEGIFELGIPILGICYGCQLLAHHLGGEVTAAEDENAREYGKTLTFYENSCLLFARLPMSMVNRCWMAALPTPSHCSGHEIEALIIMWSC